MRIRILSFVLILFFVHSVTSQVILKSPVSLKVASENTDSLKLSYCNDTILNLIGIGANYTIKAGIHLPADKMKAYTGNQITKIRIGAAYGDLLNTKLFLAVSKDSVPFYTQNITLQNAKWNTITLNTPYQISGSDLFIGYQVTSGAANYYPVGTDEGPAFAEGGWLKTINSVGTSSDWFRLKTSVAANLSLQAVIEGAQLPQNCVYLNSLKMYDFVQPNVPMNLKGSLTNSGLNLVQSANLQLLLNNVPFDTISISGLNLKTNRSVDFVSTETFMFKETGAATFSVKVIGVNAVSNEFVNEQSTAVTISSQFFKRNVILEHFTTASCPNCPFATSKINAAMSTRPDAFEIQHHAGYYTDALTIPESSSYLWFYNTAVTGGTFAPAIMIDRTNFHSLGMSITNSACPIMNVGTTTEIGTLLDNELNQPAYVSVNIDNHFNLDTRNLNVKVYGQKLKNITRSTGALPKIFVALVEDSLIMDQTGPSGVIKNYRHDNVIRDLISNVLYGTSFTFNSDDTYLYTLNYSVPEFWNEKHLKVIAFIGYAKVTSQNECEILNADRKPLNFFRTEVAQIRNDLKLKVTGNKVLIGKENVESVKVFDLLGNLRYTTNQNTFEIQNKGVYLISVQSQGTETVQKVVIQ